MTDYEKIEEIARKNNNVFKTQMVIEAGIQNFEKIRKGGYCYIDKTAWILECLR